MLITRLGRLMIRAIRWGRMEASWQVGRWNSMRGMRLETGVRGFPWISPIITLENGTTQLMSAMNSRQPTCNQPTSIQAQPDTQSLAMLHISARHPTYPLTAATRCPSTNPTSTTSKTPNTTLSPCSPNNSIPPFANIPSTHSKIKTNFTIGEWRTNCKRKKSTRMSIRKNARYRDITVHRETKKWLPANTLMVWTGKSKRTR